MDKSDQEQQRHLVKQQLTHKYNYRTLKQQEVVTKIKLSLRIRCSYAVDSGCYHASDR